MIRDDGDASRLLMELHGALGATDVALHGYALLPRGLWLVATPADAGGLGRAMQSIGRRYVRWVNDRRGETGGLFAGRFKAAALEPETTGLLALRYIDALPARLAAAPEQYLWSSCRAHLGLATDPHLKTLPTYWALGNTPFDRQAAYRRLLETGLEPAAVDHFERALAGGWVVGSASFVDRIKSVCARRPKRSHPGRPRRGSAASVR